MENSNDEYLLAKLDSQLQMSLPCTNTRLQESYLSSTVVDQVHVWVILEEEKNFSFWACNLWIYIIPLISKTLPCLLNLLSHKDKRNIKKEVHWNIISWEL